MREAEAKGSFLISGCEVVLQDKLIPRGAVLAEAGRIVFAGELDRLPKALPDGCRRIDADGLQACPALWEAHIHGCGGTSTERMTAESLGRMAAFLAQRGVGAFLPTVVPDEETLRALGSALEDSRAEVRGRALGIYVEGPFVSRAKRGAIPEELLRLPSLEYLQRMMELSRRHIRMLTVAPELDGAPALIARLPGLGILPAVGHSDAAFEDLAAVEGIEPLVVTHLFNGMSGVSHKAPGLAQWALMNRRAYAELNGDGTHVHDATVRLALQFRPADRIVVISDAVAPAGLPLEQSPGRLYGRTLTARSSGLFYEQTGVLVGSRFLVPDVVRRLIRDFGLPVPEAVAMASRNPAQLLGYTRKGALLPGYDADIAVFSADFSRCFFLSWEGEILHK